MSYKIRHYIETDLANVLSCWENASKIAHPFLTETFLNQERYNIPHVYLPKADTWVAEKNGIVVGFIALIGNEVGAIFVQPDHHRVGVGRALMDKAQELHFDLEVEVFERNTSGLKFYLSYGFKLLGQKRHEATGNNLLRLIFSTNKTADQ